MLRLPTSLCVRQVLSCAAKSRWRVTAAITYTSWSRQQSSATRRSHHGTLYRGFAAIKAPSVWASVHNTPASDARHTEVLRGFAPGVSECVALVPDSSTARTTPRCMCTAVHSEGLAKEHRSTSALHLQCLIPSTSRRAIHAAPLPRLKCIAWISAELISTVAPRVRTYYIRSTVSFSGDFAKFRHPLWVH
ncbi:hypothetical protein CGC20_26050 [Leishmania donovani]|uniref:Uncharacterized protein n=1 Tax=Leishmania donovani TaxID=5661 RepID=A0A504Y0H4_LEIDO|nr:hypothetical protein CGC20_26050 [Leishmania donovani]